MIWGYHHFRKPPYLFPNEWRKTCSYAAFFWLPLKNPDPSNMAIFWGPIHPCYTQTLPLELRVVKLRKPGIWGPNHFLGREFLPFFGWHFYLTSWCRSLNFPQGSRYGISLTILGLRPSMLGFSGGVWILRVYLFFVHGSFNVFTKPHHIRNIWMCRRTKANTSDNWQFIGICS